MFSKKIKNVDELEQELKKVYDRTDEKVVKEYVGTAQVVENPIATHTVSGCCDCPFVKAVQMEGDRVYSYCIWDGSKSDISELVAIDAASPQQCPLKNTPIRVTLK